MKVRSKAKRFFAVLLSLAMVISMMPTVAFADISGVNAEWSKAYTFNIPNGGGTGTVTVTAKGNSSMTYPDDATVPETFYKGMTLEAKWEGVDSYTYNSSGPSSANQWCVYKNGSPIKESEISLLEENSEYFAAFYYGSGITGSFNASGGESWISPALKLVIPVAMDVPTSAKSTSTALTVEQGGTAVTSADEGSVLKLTAAVTSGAAGVTTGTVTYYADNVAVGTVLAGDSFEYTVPMLSGAAKTVNFDAKYSGAGAYAASQTAASTSVSVNSVTIVNDGAAVTASPVLKMNTESTLSITGAVKDSAGNALTENAADGFKAEYYQNSGNGVWTKLPGNTATPLNSGYAYVARIIPTGKYTEGAFETAPIGGGDIDMVSTTVAVVRAGTGDIYQNNPETYTATVTDGTNNVAGGTVSFYYEKDGTSVFVNTVPVVDGAASCEVSFPEATTDASKYTVKAVYSGNNIYDSGNAGLADQVVKSTTIDAVPSLNVDPALAAETASTLALEDMTGYTLGTDYVVVWEQNDGSGWSEFDRAVTASDGLSTTVTPDSDKWSYRAVILPIGKYTAPENGIVAGPTAASPTKVATRATLEAAPAGAVEGQPIKLTASVKDGGDNPAVGTVVFYKGSDNSGEKLGEALLDSVGQADISTVAPEYGAAQAYFAEYLGNDTYAESTASCTYNSASSVLMVSQGAGIAITGDTADDGTLVVGRQYTLETPAVTDEAGTVKAEGKDYNVIWQQSVDSGKNWTDFGSYSGTAINVVPATNNTEFRAVIVPAGVYTAIKEGSDGTEKSELILDSKTSSTASTITTLIVTPETCKEGEKVTLSVDVKEKNNDDGIVNVNGRAVTGTVRVYLYVDGITGDIAIGYKDLDSQGRAVFETEAPEYTGTEDTYYYYAVYDGNSSYAGSGAASNTVSDTYVDDLTVASNKIVTKDDSKAITIYPNDATLIVNKEYTLTIPEVYQQGTTTPKLTCGEDYNVQWQVSYDNGETWTALANEGDSITVTPEQKNAQYKALITPYGAYKYAFDGTDTVEKLTMATVKSTVVETTTTLAVKDTASDETKDGTVYKTEYEGEAVTLEATVKEVSDKETLAESGYVYFYNDGVLLNTVPAEVKDGVATLVTPMTEYGASNTQDRFTAKYVANDSYGESEDAAGVTVLIRSTKIDVPVIQASYGSSTETTSADAVDGLPAGTPIEFSLTGTVTALDGRTLTAGTDYTLQWEKNSNQGMFVEISGATDTPYNLAKGENGDSFRLTLKPAGHMTAGNTSLTATIGTLSNPEVTINVTTPYNKEQGAHYGDEVAISVRIKGESSLPTGVVSFWYDANNDGLGEVQIGDYITLSKSTNPSDTNIAVAKVTTTALPQDQMKIYVKYHGDTMFQAEDTYGTNIDASAIKSDYKVWSTEIENTDDAQKLSISVTKKNGAAVTDVTTVLDAASTYELTLRTPIFTEDNQELTAPEYEIVWQQSENGIDWVKVPGAENKAACTVSPENDNMQYRAQVTTTYDLFAPPLVTVPTRLDTELSNVIGCNPQAVKVDVTTSMTNADAPYKDSVYEGNEITLYAEVIPTDAAHTEAVGGKVEFYYSVYDEVNNTYGALTAVPSSDPKDGGDNEAAVIERDGKYYAAITTTDLPAKADGKMQQVSIVAWYLGDGTYDALKPAAAADTDRKVTVYSSTVYADSNVQNQILPDTISGGKPTEATAGIIIYAPDDVLVSDGSATVLTLKNLYTLDAQDGSNPALAAAPGEYTYLTENTNYTVQWQYTTALNTANPENSSWIKLDAAGHQATVSPLAGYAYRAVITVDQSAERTVKSQKTYYSNILAAETADAVLQLRATPASSGGFKDTDLVFDAYVSGGTTVPVGNITLTLNGTLGSGVNRTATAVNGHVKFGGGIGDTAGTINLPADVYAMKASYEGNNGYKVELNEQTYIVRYKAEEVAVNLTESAYEGLVYDGTIQRPDQAAVTFNGGAGHDAAQNKADASVVFNYEMKNGDSWAAVDAPFDAGEYRVTAVLPESIYYEAQKSDSLTFSIAQREVEIDDILVQAKVYDGTADANILDVELKNVVAGDSVYTTGTAVTGKADALADNTVTYTAAGLVGPDASNYKFKADGDSMTEPFTVARNLITVDSSAIAGTALTGIKVYDNYGKEMKKDTDYTVRYFYHDGSGVKETANLNKAGKYTVIIAPKDTANYKGGESFVMNIADDKSVTFEGNDAAAPAVPGIIDITGTQQLWNADSVTAEASNGSTVNVSYNVTVDKAGRYGVTAAAAGCDETHGILTVYKAEAEHIVPVVDNKVFDGEEVSVANAGAFTTPGTYFTYTGGEIIGISYDAPKDAGEYTVTAHVPATDTTVAYTETSTFEITQKPITVSAIAVTKETFRTNPALRVTYDGLVTGDSDIKDMLVLPSFDLLNTEGVNHDLNQVGDFTIVPYGIVSRNYKVETYNNANFAVQHTDPALQMNIVGLPNGQVYYGDEFQVSLYGTVAERADGNGTYNNPSSVINYFVSDGAGWSQDNGNVTIDNDGNVKIRGAAAADFTIKAERGTGDYKIVATVDVNVKKRPIFISMIGEDSKVYAGADQNVDVSKYVVSGSLEPITLTLANFAPNAGRDVDEYLITASYSDDKYEGEGKGLMTVTPAPAVVTSNDNPANIYGQTPDVQDADYSVSGNVGTDSAADVIDSVVTKSDVRFNSDVDNYEIFSAGVENKNYDVSYESGKYEVVAKALTKAAAGVDDKTVINTITAQVKRAYGVVNPQMGYQVDGLIAGDSLADLIIDKNFVVYSRVQEDNANVAGSASNENVKALDTEYVNGYKINDGYGLIDLHDSLANINADALNYTMTPEDGLLDIYQSNVTIDVQDLTVKKGTTLSDSSYYAVVYRVLTEAPMNDTIADLRMHFTPLGIAGQETCVTGTENIDVALETGSTTLGLAEYFAQNYYASKVNKGDLTVKDKEAAAVISPNKDGVTVKTTVELAPVYIYDAAVSAYTKATDKYVILDEVTATANGDGYAPVDGLTLYDGSVAADGIAAAGFFVKSGEKAAKPVNVGNIDYIVIDKNGNKKANGTMTADAAKPGEYAGTFNPALSNGSYTILLDPTGDYALNPTVKDFTVGDKAPSGGGGGGGFVEPPVLIKDDHFAYMQGDDYGYFRPDSNLTRAEAATIFYNLLTDKSMGDMTTSFSDVNSGDWYAKAVNTLASRGILGGYEDGTFKPAANITRAEFAAIASRFDDLSSGTASFTDVPSTHWAYSYIVSAATKGWITGYEDGTFKPEANITRAEVVTLVNRVLDRVPDKSFIDKNIDDIKVLKDVKKDHWAYYYMIEATNGHDYSKDDKGNETWKKLK